MHRLISVNRTHEVSGVRAISVQPLFLPGNSETYQSAGEVQVQVLVIHRIRGSVGCIKHAAHNSGRSWAIVKDGCPTFRLDCSYGDNTLDFVLEEYRRLSQYVPKK